MTEGSKSINTYRIFERLQGAVAAEIRVMLGESPYPQSMFDESQIERRIAAMMECASRSTSDEERHESWMKMHLDSGWVYGEVFDPKTKTHPNLMPWDQLPASTRSKARIFDLMSKAAAEVHGLVVDLVMKDVA